MPSLSLLSSVALGLLALNPIMVQASPIPPTHVQLAARAFASGGTSCYNTCPTTTGDGATLTGGFTEGATIWHCSYTGGTDGGGWCHYDPRTGLLNGASSQALQCRPQADFSSCGPTAGPGEFKREMPKKQLTRAERIIQERQYHPVKN